MRYVCTKKCFFKGRIFRPGDAFVGDAGANPYFKAEGEAAGQQSAVRLTADRQGQGNVETGAGAEAPAAPAAEAPAAKKRKK